MERPADIPPPRRPRTPPAPGDVLAGRYRVERLLARGGMATVFLAQQLGLERKVALKVLSPPADLDEIGHFEERFRLEAATLAGLDHPNIVTLYDYGEADGHWFLAMEYVDGPQLTELLRDGPLSPARATELMLQICAGLRYAHRRGVVHRDLKPSNLLVKYGDEGHDRERAEIVKLVDFGLVKLTESDQSITRAGVVMGSPQCISPEQVRGVEVDHRADLYSLGVILFRMLTGKYPFIGENGTATMSLHVIQRPPALRSVAPNAHVEPELEAVVMRCLEKDPRDRFQDVAELVDALRLAAGLPLDPNRTDTTRSAMSRTLRPAPPARAASPWGPILVAAGVFAASVLFALGVGALWWVRLGPGAPVPAASEPEPPVAAAPLTAPPKLPEPPVAAVPPPAAPPAPLPVAPPVAPPPPVAAAPAPAPRPAPPKPAEPATPEGYLGLPDDL